MRPEKKILVLGAGIAGLSAAWHLQQKGISCQVFEKEAEVGGLCRSRKVNGFTFDQSGHLLHFKHRYVFDLVRELLKDNLVQHKRSAWVYSFGRYTRYPFQANLFGLPPKITQECLKGFIQAQTKDCAGRARDFSQWIKRTFGAGIARYFMIPYNSKFWTVPPEQLTCEWVDRMIPVPSLGQVIEGAKKESTKQIGYNANFWYPKEGGIGQLPQAFARRIKEIHTGSRIARIDLIRKEVQTVSGRKEKFDQLISTVPLPEMASVIGNLPSEIRSAFNKLRWNSVYNLNLGVDLKGDFGQHWAYFPEKRPCFFRVGFFHNFSSDLVPAGKRSLYAEVSYSKGRPVAKAGILSRIIRGLEEVGIFTKGSGISAKDMNDIEYGYPIYDRHYKAAREKALGFLNENGILSCGRYGSWQYMSMEDAILDGKRAAESVQEARR